MKQTPFTRPIRFQMDLELFPSVPSNLGWLLLHQRKSGLEPPVYTAVSMFRLAHFTIHHQPSVLNRIYIYGVTLHRDVSSCSVSFGDLLSLRSKGYTG